MKNRIISTRQFSSLVALASQFLLRYRQVHAERRLYRSARRLTRGWPSGRERARDLVLEATITAGPLVVDKFPRVIIVARSFSQYASFCRLHSLSMKTTRTVMVSRQSQLIGLAPGAATRIHFLPGGGENLHPEGWSTIHARSYQVVHVPRYVLDGDEIFLPHADY